MFEGTFVVETVFLRELKNKGLGQEGHYKGGIAPFGYELVKRGRFSNLRLFSWRGNMFRHMEQYRKDIY